MITVAFLRDVYSHEGTELISGLAEARYMRVDKLLVANEIVAL